MIVSKSIEELLRPSRDKIRYWQALFPLSCNGQHRLPISLRKYWNSWYLRTWPFELLHLYYTCSCWYRTRYGCSQPHSRALFYCRSIQSSSIFIRDFRYGVMALSSSQTAYMSSQHRHFRRISYSYGIVWSNFCATATQRLVSKRECWRSISQPNWPLSPLLCSPYSVPQPFCHECCSRWNACTEAASVVAKVYSDNTVFLFTSFGW